ncbi:MAG TPA: hypothetical protein VGB53_11750 [Rubricoccaceae bacterium]|jgi:ribosomal protein S27AE
MDTPTTEPFDESWRRYRRWYRTSLALQVGFLPSFLALGALAPGVADRAPLVVGLVVVYAGAWMTCTEVARRWRCPKCGELFFFASFNWVQPPMALVPSCGSCGLPKYARGPARAA